MKHTIFATLLIVSMVYSSFATPTTTETKLNAPDAFLNQQFGRSVAIDGDTAVIGAPTTTVGGDGVGSAYVYVRTASGWQLQQKLTAPGVTMQTLFGLSVDVDGNTIVVGAPFDDNAGPSSGAAYVFERSNNVWSIKQKLTGSENSTSDVFGLSVAIDGNTIVCGALGNTSSADPQVGTAYVFNLTSNQWVETQKLNASDPSPQNGFGVTVAIDGNTIIVGATGHANFSGAVYVFSFVGSSWVEQEILTANNPAPKVVFGYKLGLSGETIVVASQGFAGNGRDLVFSAAYIFRRTPSGWHQQKKITTGDVEVMGVNEIMGRFDLNIAVSGDTVVVGSQNDPTLAYFSGSVYVYRRNGESNWNLDQQIFPSDAARDDLFGSALAIDGSTLVVGSWEKSITATFSGAAYIYEL